MHKIIIHGKDAHKTLSLHTHLYKVLSCYEEQLLKLFLCILLLFIIIICFKSVETAVDLKNPPPSV